MTAYKVEELLALRDSASESAVSFIEKFGDEEAIKEHVLRPSASVGVIGSQTSAASSRPPAVQQSLAAAAISKKPSPSPSVKRGKAERLIKEHGSPPGMRVTAGGRVVPIDLPPLSSPRFPFNNQKAQMSSRATSAPHLIAGNALNGASALPISGAPPIFIVVNGQICQVHNGQLLPLPVVDHNSPFGNQHQPPHDATMNNHFASHMVNGMGMPAPNPLISPLAAQIPISLSGIPPSPSLAPSQQVAQDPNLEISAKTRLLDQEYSKYEMQLKELERLEVIQADYMGAQWRQEVIKTKRTFITVLDAIRKLSKGLHSPSPDNIGTATVDALSKASSNSATLIAPALHTSTSQAQLHALANGSMTQLSPLDMAAYFQSIAFQQSMDPRFNPASSGVSPALLNPPLPLPAPVAPNNLQQTTSQPAPASKTTHTATSGGQTSPWRAAGPRRSHAVEIKDPKDGVKKPTGQQSKSALNPTSPTYEPNPRATPEPRSPGIFVPPSPSPIPSPGRHQAVEAQHPWLFNQAAQLEGSGTTNTSNGTGIKHKSSATSVQTADFFPHNTHEHSTKLYNGTASKQGSPLKMTPFEDAPITPEKQFLMSLSEKQYRSPNDENSHPAAPPVTPADTRGSTWNKDIRNRMDGTGSLSSNDTMKQEWTLELARNHATVASALNAFNQAPRAAPVPHHDDANQEDLNLPSASFIHGYSAGFVRAPFPSGGLGDDFIIGYGEGLRMSKQQQGLPPNGNKFNDVHQATSSSIVPKPAPVMSTNPMSAMNNGALRKSAGSDNTQNFATKASVDAPFVTRPGASIWSPTKSEFTKESHDRRGTSTAFGTSTSNPGSDQPLMEVRTNTSMAVPTSNVEFQSQKGFNSAPGSGIRSFSNILPGTGMTSVSTQRYFPPMRIPGHSTPSQRSPRKNENGRISQCDGASDEALIDVSSAPTSPSKASGSQSQGTSPKKADSPAKAKLEHSAASIANKAGRSSKGKKPAPEIEKRSDDPKNMSERERSNFRQNWRNRFQRIAHNEKVEVEKYEATHPL